MSYCASCRDHTHDVQPYLDYASNGRLVKKSHCGDCGSRKSTFVPEGVSGSGLSEIATIAQAAGQATGAVSGTINKGLDLVGQWSKQSFQKRQETGRFKKIAARNDRRQLNATTREFNKLKREQRWGKLPHSLTEQDLWNMAASTMH